MSLCQEDRLQALVHAREIDQDDSVACIVAKMSEDGSIRIFRAGSHALVVMLASVTQFNEHATMAGIQKFIEPLPLKPREVPNDRADQTDSV